MSIANLTCHQGDTFTRTVTITDSAGAPVNITGAALTLHVRALGGTVDVITPAPTLTLTTPLSGIATMVVSATETASLTAQKTYSFEVEMVEAGGAITTALMGLLYCEEDLG